MTTFIHVGPVGTATIAKVMSNMLCGVNFIAGYEALMIAKKVQVAILVDCRFSGQSLNILTLQFYEGSGTRQIKWPF